MLVVRKPQDNFSKLIEALVFSFLIYVLVVGVLGIPPIVPPVSDTSSLTGQAQVNPRFLIAIFVVAIALPLILGFFSTHDVHMKVLRWLRVTEKTARDTTCEPEEGLLYLYNPAWINEDGCYTHLDIHGLFLVEKGSIESIEFTHITEKNAIAVPPGGQEDEQKENLEP